MSNDIQEQLNLLKSRTVDLHSEEELRKKLEKAAAEGRALRV